MTALTGTVKLALQSYSAALAAVSYSSRFALGIWYRPEAWHAVRIAGWRGKYVSPTDSDVVVWIALGSLNEAEHDGTLLCSSAHAAVPIVRITVHWPEGCCVWKVHRKVRQL